MQGLLKLFGAAGRNSGLPCANVNAVAAGLNTLKSFTQRLDFRRPYLER